MLITFLSRYCYRLVTTFSLPFFFVIDRPPQFMTVLKYPFETLVKHLGQGRSDGEKFEFYLLKIKLHVLKVEVIQCWNDN